MTFCAATILADVLVDPLLKRFALATSSVCVVHLIVSRPPKAEISSEVPGARFPFTADDPDNVIVAPTEAAGNASSATAISDPTTSFFIEDHRLP
jgi:hypothetical protein